MRPWGELKAELLRLLEEDEEFRYAVMGLLGVREVLSRLDESTRAIRSLQEQVAALQRQVADQSGAIRDLQAQVAEHAKAIRSLQEQVAALQEQVAEHGRALAEHSKALERLARAVEDMGRRLAALGARWGVVAEEVFRESLRRFIEEHFRAGRVERWSYFDREGRAFGLPTLIEVDVVVKDRVHHLIEVKSSVDAYDVWAFNRKCELYRQVNKVKVRKHMVTCYANERSKEVARALGVEIICK